MANVRINRRRGINRHGHKRWTVQERDILAAFSAGHTVAETLDWAASNLSHRSMHAITYEIYNSGMGYVRRRQVWTDTKILEAQRINFNSPIQATIEVEDISDINHPTHREPCRLSMRAAYQAAHKH
jgi:hypothetical protein